jgi:hypothetical protein
MRLLGPFLFFCLAACAERDAVQAPSVAPPAQATSPGPLPTASPTAAPADEHHELSLPPVGPTVHVTFEGRSSEIAVAAIAPGRDDTVALLDLWTAAFPGVDPVPLHFDLVGSDGFHPMSRAKCTRLLTGAELRSGHMAVVTHNVSYDDTLNLPGCYRVKAVVSLEASR